jgi:hypothetical protein
MDKRREDFEKWSKENTTWDLSHNGKHYNHTYTYHAWKGFNAALDALVVELPFQPIINGNAHMLSVQVIELLTKAGIKYK